MPKIENHCVRLLMLFDAIKHRNIVLLSKLIVPTDMIFRLVCLTKLHFYFVFRGACAEWIQFLCAAHSIHDTNDPLYLQRKWAVK